MVSDHLPKSIYPQPPGIRINRNTATTTPAGPCEIVREGKLIIPDLFARGITSRSAAGPVREDLYFDDKLGSGFFARAVENYQITRLFAPDLPIRDRDSGDTN